MEAEGGEEEEVEKVMNKGGFRIQRRFQSKNRPVEVKGREIIRSPTVPPCVQHSENFYRCKDCLIAQMVKMYL